MAPEIIQLARKNGSRMLTKKTEDLTEYFNVLFSIFYFILFYLFIFFSVPENSLDLVTPVLELLRTAILCAAIACHSTAIFTDVNFPRLPCTRSGVLSISAGERI